MWLRRKRSPIDKAVVLRAGSPLRQGAHLLRVWPEAVEVGTGLVICFGEGDSVDVSVILFTYLEPQSSFGLCNFVSIAVVIWRLQVVTTAIVVRQSRLEDGLVWQTISFVRQSDLDERWRRCHIKRSGKSHDPRQRGRPTDLLPVMRWPPAPRSANWFTGHEMARTLSVMSDNRLANGR